MIEGIRFLFSRRTETPQVRRIAPMGTVIGSWNCVLNSESSFKGVDETFLDELRTCKSQLCRAAGIDETAARDIDFNFESRHLQEFQSPGSQEKGVFSGMVQENTHFQQLFGTHVIRTERNGEVTGLFPALNLSGDPFGHSKERIIYVDKQWWVPSKAGSNTTILEPISDEQFGFRVRARQREMEGSTVIL